jgi:hypothetical protein
MKKSDWLFLVVAAALALAIWYFFIRKGAPAPLVKTTTRAEPNQDAITGSGIVQGDAEDFAAGYYGLDYSALYP